MNLRKTLLTIPLTISLSCTGPNETKIGKYTWENQDLLSMSYLSETPGNIDEYVKTNTPYLIKISQEFDEDNDRKISRFEARKIIVATRKSLEETYTLAEN